MIAEGNDNHTTRLIAPPGDVACNVSSYVLEIGNYRSLYTPLLDRSKRIPQLRIFFSSQKKFDRMTLFKIEIKNHA